MFIKDLIISAKNRIIRRMEFHNGMNLIVDDTPTGDTKLTGNNVGKTTVLKLIYFCLSGDGKEIYTDVENKKAIYKEVKDFLVKEEVLITLVLVKSFDEDSDEIIIERNFLSRNKAIRKINGKQIADKDFENELMVTFFPNHKATKPTFREIISHNIRYKDESVNKTLKTLSSFTTDIEYETLYLYLLGCSFNDGEKKQALSAKIKQEKLYKERLEKKQTKNSYEIAVALLDKEIESLNKKKSSLNLNENFEKDLYFLNEIKYKINKSSSIISKLEIRKGMILEAKKEMEQKISNIDLKQLELLYQETKKYLPDIQKKFEDLVKYHNKMILEKIRFITKELPFLEEQLDIEKKNMKELLEKEKEFSTKISKSDSFEDLEKIISELNEKYRLKGEYENTITQIGDIEAELESLEKELKVIDNSLYSTEFDEKLKAQVFKFNEYFSKISNELYGEQYALTYEKVINKKTGKPCYKFSAFNVNMSSGKKQGEILCFDLAYILFANRENMPCFQFLLNDKKELMHDNQLLKVADFVKENKIQLVISILKDKLPNELIDKANIVVELSQKEKLFKI